MTIVGGGIDHWWLPELPARLDVLFVARLLGTSDEFGDVEHSIASRILDPDGNATGDPLEATFKIGADPGDLQGEWLNQMTMPMAISFEVTRAGTYSLEFRVDSATRQVPLHMTHGQPPAAPAAE